MWYSLIFSMVPEKLLLFPNHCASQFLTGIYSLIKMRCHQVLCLWLFTIHSPNNMHVKSISSAIINTSHIVRKNTKKKTKNNSNKLTKRQQKKKMSSLLKHKGKIYAIFAWNNKKKIIIILCYRKLNLLYLWCTMILVLSFLLQISRILNSFDPVFYIKILLLSRTRHVKVATFRIIIHHFFPNITTKISLLSGI